MRRSTPRLTGVALVMIAGLVLVGCSSKSAAGTSGGGSPASANASSSAAAGGGGALTIQPLVQVDSSGKEVTASASTAPADPAGDGKATCSGVAIAMMGALTGANAALGQNIVNGVQLAIDEHNAANSGCQVQLKKFDTEGAPEKATQVAPSVVSDSSVIGIVGPAFSGESKATGPVFSQANLLMLTPSATNPSLTQQGWKNFFRGLGNDNSQGAAAANYMTGALGYKKVCVVQDDSDYGVGLAQVVTKTLGSAADSACAGKVKTGDKDFSATVQLIKSESPDAIYYAGYYAEAAPFLSQLRSAGVTAAFVSDDGVNDPQLIKQAGSAAKGAYLTCPCGPAPQAYAAKYQAKFGQASGTYSVEGYDLATIILKGIDSGVKDRQGMVNFVANYDGQGLAKHYKWDSTGELGATTTWIYQVK